MRKRNINGSEFSAVFIIFAYVKTQDKLYDDRKSLKVPVSVIRKGDQLVLKVQ